MVAGSVVKHHYKTIDDEYRTGIFLVIYDEEFDSSISFKGNVLGLKITSTGRELHYDVPLLQLMNPFLDHNSFVMCSKLHVLDKRDVTLMGYVTFADLLKVYTNFKRLNYSIDKQVCNAFLSPKIKEGKL